MEIKRLKNEILNDLKTLKNEIKNKDEIKYYFVLDLIKHNVITKCALCYKYRNCENCIVKHKMKNECFNLSSFLNVINILATETSYHTFNFLNRNEFIVSHLFMKYAEDNNAIIGSLKKWLLIKEICIWLRDDPVFSNYSDNLNEEFFDNLDLFITILKNLK